jgi:hypothetical protein
MKKGLLLFGIVALLMLSVVSAETCFTAINVPQNNNGYWKSVTYTGLRNGYYDNFLTTTTIPPVIPVLAGGQQFTLRLENDCFNGNLLSNKDVTGMTSSQINLNKVYVDYQTPDFIANKLYTLSLVTEDVVSTSLVKEVPTGYVDAIDYLALPDTFPYDDAAHTQIKAMAEDVCDPDLKITTQMENIKLSLWSVLEPSSDSVSCSAMNMVDCYLSKGRADSRGYAASAMVLGRLCGVPTRVAYGISEGDFDGVDISFDADKMHYWIEFYDDGWLEQEVTEGGSTLPSGVETNCINNVDDDDDGNIDCWDSDCSSKEICSSWPSTTDFDNAFSTLLTTLPNAYSVNDLTLGNEFGSVTWTDQSLDIRGVDLDLAITITDEQIVVTNNVPVLANPDVGVLRDVANPDPKILLNGQPCPACVIDEVVNGAVTFSMNGVGNYTVSPVVVVNESDVPVVVPKKETGFLKDPVDWVKTQWDKLTNVGKIVLIVVVAGVVFLWWRRHRRKNRFNRFRGRG